MPVTPSERRTHRGAAALSAVALFACGPKSVQGSLAVLMDMTFESMEVVRGSNDLTVRFTKPEGAGEDLVLAVSARGVSFPDAGEPGPTWDLAEQTGSGQRGALARNVLNDPQQTFPAIERGHLSLTTPPGFGETVSGDFSVTFVLGTEFGSGRTLFSNFRGEVR